MTTVKPKSVGIAAQPIAMPPDDTKQECIERPWYFSGQMLTDEDLNAQVEWAREKRRLDRKKHGYGVVQGLEVVADPKNQAGVIVLPGYAVDQEGNDIIVCEPTRLDLSEACQEEDDCIASIGKNNRRSRQDATPEPASEHIRVDIRISYREDLAQPKPALARQTGGGPNQCHYSRLIERHALRWSYALEETGDSVLEKACEQWEMEFYRYSRKVLVQYRKDNPTSKLQWFRDWVSNHPLHEILFVYAYLNAPENFPGDMTTTLLFAILQDARLHYLRTRTILPDAEPEVRLARVKFCEFKNNKNRCRVQYINNFPPYRTELQQDRWPAPAGMLNLGRYIWHPTDMVCNRLGDLGVRCSIKKQNQEIFSNVEELIEFVNQTDISVGEKGDKIGLFLKRGCDFEQKINVIYLGHEVHDGVFGFGHYVPEQELVVDPKPAPPPRDDQKSPANPEPVPDLNEKFDSDDFTQIDGIGKERAKKLYESGIHNFKQLAQVGLDTLREIFPKISPSVLDEWRKQAAMRPA